MGLIALDKALDVLRPHLGPLHGCIEAAWNEAWVGGEQVRAIRFDDDRLFIESPPMPHPNIDDKTVRVIVVWQREKN